MFAEKDRFLANLLLFLISSKNCDIMVLITAESLQTKGLTDEERLVGIFYAFYQ